MTHYKRHDHVCDCGVFKQCDAAWCDEYCVCSACRQQMYADGRAHYYSENIPTVNCGACSGSGRTFDADAVRAAAARAVAAEEKP
jgi:hypothetical protein